jgi:rfaE bifunctional protein kinase chain/domain
VAAIQKLRPDCFVAGTGAGTTGVEAQAVKEAGGTLVVAPAFQMGAPVPVSNPLSAYSPEVADYLQAFGTLHPPESLVSWLRRASGLKVLVVGEAIVDEYHYCETMGKSGKEPILATRYLSSERFAGGTLAVANNVAAFTERVTLLTVLGSQDGQPDPTEPFVRESLDPRVRPVFIHQGDAPTILKRRYVERYPLQKLFEVYHLRHMEENGPEARDLCARLEELVPLHDVVIVTDYGHGMLTPEAVEILCAKAKFLAVNTQANADNQGFNTVSKYRRADFVSLSERELRLEVRSKGRETGAIMEEVSRRLGCRTMLITRGAHGNLVFDAATGLHHSPSLSNRILDRVGAGDTVLSAASLCVAQGAPADVVGFLSNVVGACAVATVGHRSFLNLDKLDEHITALLG